MSQSLLGSYKASEEQRGSCNRNARLPEENSLSSTRVPKFFHVLHTLSSALGTGAAFYIYERLLYSPLHTPHRIPQKHVLGQAKTQVVLGEDLDKA